MSADDVNAQKVEALRQLGHLAAADDLAMLLEADAEQRKDAEREVQKQVGPPGIPLLSGEAGVHRAAQAEGRIVAEALRRSGAGQSWVSAGPLFGASEGGGH